MPVSGSKRAVQIEMRVALHVIRVPKDIILATPRYPGDYEPIPLAEARQAVQIARRLRQQVRKGLPKDSLQTM